MLGKPRPAIGKLKKPKGLSKGEWKVREAELKRLAAKLPGGIEEAVRLREDHSFGEATPETVAKARAGQRRAGSMARLHGSGALADDQLAAAQEIAEAFEALTAAVKVKTSSLAARVDCEAGAGGPALVGKSITALVYDRWRALVERPEAVMLMIVEDVGVARAAAAAGVGVPRMKRLLVAGLDLWIELRGGKRRG